jgi:hypothetical protein
MGTAWNIRSLLYLLAHPKPTIPHFRKMTNPPADVVWYFPDGGRGGVKIPVPEGAIILWNVMRHVDQLCRDGHISGKEDCDIQDTCLKLLQEFREEATK